MTEFGGPYAQLLCDYVSFRIALGFVVPASTRRILRHMADYPYTLPLIPEVIDECRADEIAAARDGESERTRQSRFVAMRQLCLWLRRTGVGAYVPPPGQVKARSDFVPRIVSEGEMARIIDVAEAGSLPWVPMVLKILWRTGIRVGEAAAPRVGGFSPSGRSLYVAHAKNDRSRVIPVSASLAASLGTYLEGCVADARHEAWLFPGKRAGEHRNKVAVSNRLRGIYRKAGVLTPDGRPIRTHDLRHSFAIRALEGMVERGRAGVAWVLSKHAEAARQGRPDLVPGKVHPHMLRHSKAMHLLESGVNLVYIRDFPGRSSVTTTEVYARASTKAKREAIERAAKSVIRESAYYEEWRSDLIDWLRGIM